MRQHFFKTFCQYLNTNKLLKSASNHHYAVELKFIATTYLHTFSSFTTHSQCLEDTKKMPLEPGGALAAG